MLSKNIFHLTEEPVY